MNKGERLEGDEENLDDEYEGLWRLGLKVDTSEATSPLGRHKDVADSNIGKNKESDVVDEESKSEVEDVYDETTSFMTFKSRGGTEKKSLYECWKDDYDQGRL
ncbi:hypothetical protein Tco_0989222 [Tanacetum coccineum]|uniref:Uncharacterized protein n=1 Tax=Tanacetum coccineum TaxID=301880 RepID=A0ABQ5ETR3_9ASTR